jgi:hypothetical protein
MSLRARLVAVIALLMQVSAPLAAYAVAVPGPGSDDFCSVAKRIDRTPLPAPDSVPVDRHALSHCALCAGGSASAALPAPPVPTLMLVHMPSERIASDSTFLSHEASIRPRARGPPLLV